MLKGKIPLASSFTKNKGDFSSLID